MITIIIPCLNEKKNINLIKKNLALFNKSKHIIVDGKSRDNSRTIYFKEKLNFIIVSPSRGLQLKKGAEASNTKWLFFLHADTKLNKKNILEIYNFMSFRNAFKAGFFKMEYRKKNFWANLISCWANLRSKIFRLPFGDQGLIISRYYYFKLGGHFNEKIMEDLDLILRVPRKNRILFNSKVSTSFRRFEKNGILLQGFIHLLCQFMFFLNFKKNLIYKFYNFYGK